MSKVSEHYCEKLHVTSLPKQYNLTMNQLKNKLPYSIKNQTVTVLFFDYSSVKIDFLKLELFPGYFNY